MRCRLPTCAAIVLLATACGNLACAEPPANAGAAATAALGVWDGVGNEAAPAHSGWNWRPQGDPTLPDNAAAPTNALTSSGGGFNSEAAGLDGAGSEIYTIGGKPLLGGAGAPTPERKGPFSFLSDLTPKGVPAPATWALIAIGFLLIGVAVRGLLLANRRLARLRSEGED